MSETCKHGIKAPRECLVCMDGAQYAKDRELSECVMWRLEHLDGLMRSIRACTDVQTLRALAHRLGYKEGM